MMMSSLTSPLASPKSSLEEMLDSLRRRDESDEPKDSPPALPPRPVSKARLPSARRSLPTNFRVGNRGNGDVHAEENIEGKELRCSEEENRKQEDFNSSLGSKKMSTEQNVESPYEENINGFECAAQEKVAENDSNCRDVIGHFMRKKFLVWCRVPKGQWESGRIQSISGEEVFVSLSKGTVVKVSTGEILPANPEILDGVEDLRELSYLNEPSVLHNLQRRYLKDIIYSKAGRILIALNPFKDVPIHGDDFVTAYSQRKSMNSAHVYATVDTTYIEMMRDGVDQSIIISGESGAGKTETAKYAMQYLATVGGGNSGVEYEILSTNCILEAFGNAKTSINNNSSRFGKMIEIHFSRLGKIRGAIIHTFLLEKSRVVQPSIGERSYHIFYQLCAGASSTLKERFKLKTASEYNYLTQSDCLAIDGTDDAKKFDELLVAFDSIQLSQEDQENVFALVATVLWLGNISFHVIGDGSHVEVVLDEAVTNAAMLMSCSAQELMLALSTHKFQASQDGIQKKLALQQAINTRDALAKCIYVSLFDWLVEQMNMAIKVGKLYTGRSISILDWYGFESFKKNSFQQFCINYANERLQQHFNRHSFKLEQEAYESDGIDCSRVEFKDNQECLDLFEKKPIGLLSLLDEESNIPKATDLTFASKLKQHLNENPCFKGERGRAFGVHHYAGEVLYDTNGFLEQNRDPLNLDLVKLLSSCNCQLPQLFATKLSKQSQKPGSLLDSDNPSVCTKLKGQLFKLIKQLERTRPHFILCLKPNTKQLPGIYEENLVLQQIRHFGILEIVRISRSGYPTRMKHQEFAERYSFLLSERDVSQDPLSLSIAILRQFDACPEMYQVGFTNLYLRTRLIGVLEDRRKQVMLGTLGVQKCFHGCQARQYFHELRKGAITIQSFVRGEITRKKYVTEVKMHASVAPKVLNEQLTAVVFMQSVIRGWLVRKKYNNMHHTKQLICGNGKPGWKLDKKTSQVEDIPEKHIQFPPLVVSELQRRVLNVEAALEQKEKENATLQEQLRQFETKLNAIEDKHQRKILPLRSHFAAEFSVAQQSNLGPSTSPLYCESEVSMGTPGGSTPNMFCRTTPDARAGRMSNLSVNAVSNLVSEFEQRKQTFDSEVNSLADVKTEDLDSILKPYEELKKLNMRFETWKQDYKTRIRETKARLHKLEGKQIRRNWWGKRSSRA